MTQINVLVPRYSDLAMPVTVTNRKCKVCAAHYQYKAGQYSGNPDNGSCTNCQFWIEKVGMRNHLDVARINGQHYILGENQRGVLGMGGQKTVVKFFDGRVKTTVDLWHQGTIPAAFANILPNNAEFVEAI